MQNARSAALKVLNRCFSSGAWASQALENEIKDFEPRDRALATRLTLGVLQNYALLDFYINDFCSKLDLPVRNIIRLGAYQILFSDKIPVSAAVNESVNLCRSAGFKSACGLVNAVLRKISKGPLPKTDDLSILYSHPKWFVDKMIADHGMQFTEELLKANNAPVGETWHESFIDGERYVQDEAAYTAVTMAAPEEGSRVLDCCSAPGGKSFTAAMLMHNRGEIISCDIHGKKLSLVEEGAKRLGINIIKTQTANAAVYNPEFEKAFDLVIADVPCSGLGVIRKKPEIRFKTEQEISDLPEIQKKILNNVSHYVNQNGRLLYSTCTVLKEENEAVSHSLNGFDIIDEKTFWPNIDGTDGFYACVLRRKN